MAHFRRCLCHSWSLFSTQSRQRQSKPALIKGLVPSHPPSPPHCFRLNSLCRLWPFYWFFLIWSISIGRYTRKASNASAVKMSNPRTLCKGAELFRVRSVQTLQTSAEYWSLSCSHTPWAELGPLGSGSKFQRTCFYAKEMSSPSFYPLLQLTVRVWPWTPARGTLLFFIRRRD